MQTIERKLIEAALDEARKAGFEAYQVNDGGENVPAITLVEVLDAVDAVCASSIHFRHSNGQRAWLYVVLGNGVDCLADHSVTAGFADAMDRVYMSQT